MADFLEKWPSSDMLPMSMGGCTLQSVQPLAITWIAPFKGERGRVSNALEDALGCSWPDPNRFTESNGTRVLSVAQGQILVLGPRVEMEGAAVVDQSDGLIALALCGDRAGDVLSRLTSVDLRDAVFKTGHTARTQLRDITVSLSRLDGDRWVLLIPRSMVEHAIDDIQRAMRGVVARAALQEKDK